MTHFPAEEHALLNRAVREGTAVVSGSETIAAMSLVWADLVTGTREAADLPLVITPTETGRAFAGRTAA